MLWSNDELDIVYDYIYIELARKVLAKDLHVLDSAPFKLKGAYRELLVCTLNHISRQAYEIKRKMKEKGLKIYETPLSAEDFTTYEARRGGGSEEFTIANHILKHETEQCIMRFFSEVKLSVDKINP
jgi:hypothetical protein